MPRVRSLLETALYVADPERSSTFYRGLFGFEILARSERLCALNVADRVELVSPGTRQIF